MRGDFARLGFGVVRRLGAGAAVPDTPVTLIVPLAGGGSTDI